MKFGNEVRFSWGVSVGTVFSVCLLAVFSAPPPALSDGRVERVFPLAGFLEVGMNPYQDDVQQIREDEPLSGDWAVTGHFRLVSRSDDPVNGIDRWDGLAAGFPPGASDFSQVRLSLVKKWKGPSGALFEETVAETSLGAGEAGGVALRAMGDAEMDGLEETRDYAFAVSLGAVSVSFPMPLECADPGLFLYELTLRMTFPVARWDDAGQGVSTAVESRDITTRKVLVSDSTPLRIVPELSFPEEGTTGDPVNPGRVEVTVSDNNPNQALEEAFVEVPRDMGRIFSFFSSESPPEPQRDHSSRLGPESDDRAVFPGLSVDLPIRGAETEVVRMPADGAPLKGAVVVRPLAGPGAIHEFLVANRDNDPPDLVFSIGPEKGSAMTTGLVVKVGGGVFDPIDGDTIGKVEISVSGGEALVCDFVEPRQRVCRVDLGEVLSAAGAPIPEISEDLRLYYAVEAVDNVDGEVAVEVSGRGFEAGQTSGAAIFRDPGETDLRIEARDAAGNVREVILPLRVTGTRFETSTIQRGSR